MSAEEADADHRSEGGMRRRLPIVFAASIWFFAASICFAMASTEMFMHAHARDLCFADWCVRYR
jgi:hypothetical protein